MEHAENITTEDQRSTSSTPFYKTQYFWACVGLIFVAFILRLVLTQVFEGHPTDIRNFKAWGMHIARNGFRGMYEGVSSQGIWCDYPPLYLLPLWFVSRFYMLFDPSFGHWSQGGFTLLAKLPSIITDLGCIAFIILILKRYIHPYLAFFAGLIFALHPAVIYESAIWGQVDSVTLLLQLIALWYLIEDRHDLAIFATALNILVKPQGLILLPLVLFIALYKKAWKQLLLGGVYSLVFAFLLSWLFVPLSVETVAGIPLPSNMVWLWGKYNSQADLYSYSSIQAFNLWSLAGNWSESLMWRKDSRSVYFLANILGQGNVQPVPSYLTHKFWGLVLFSVTYLMSLVYYVLASRKNNPEDQGVVIWHTSTLIMFAFFLFPTRMHERYLYSGLFLLLGSCLLNKRFYWVFWTLSVTFLLNLFFELPGYTGLKKDLQFPAVFFWVNDFLNGTLTFGRIPKFPYYKWIAILNCLMFVYVSVFMFLDPLIQTSQKVLDKLKTKLTELKTPNPQWIPAPRYLDMKDAYIILGFLVLSGLLKVWRLGFPPELVFDEVYHARTAGEYLTGVLTHADRTYEWVHPPLAKLLIAIGVSFYDLTGIGWRIVPVIAGTLLLMVIYILGRQTLPYRWQATLATLFLACDGVYFVQSRMAMTNIFATLFQVAALALTWRFLQFHWHRPKDKRNLWYFFGVLMMIGLALSTRWTSLWSYGFIILVFGFLVMIPSLIDCERFFHRLYLFLSELTSDLIEKSLMFQYALFISLSGSFVLLSFGISSFIKAEKSVNLFVVLFILGGLLCLILPTVALWPHLTKHMRLAPKERRINVAFFCLIPVLTLVVPLVIYTITYIPSYIQFESWKAFQDSFVFTAKMQVSIWNYHSGLKDPHPYYSTWYSWPLLYRPTWYYFHTFHEVKKIAGIIALGNPAIWWASIPVVLLVMYQALFKKALNIWYISLACLFMYLPWGLSPRTLNYAHYFFEAVPYACLCLAFYAKPLGRVFEFILAPVIYGVLWLGQLIGVYKEQVKYELAIKYSWTTGFYLYPILVVGLFILFFPILAAYPITHEYFSWTRWFPKWI